MIRRITTSFVFGDDSDRQLRPATLLTVSLPQRFPVDRLRQVHLIETPVACVMPLKVSGRRCR
jgi:hypothetical protein